MLIDRGRSYCKRAKTNGTLYCTQHHNQLQKQQNQLPQQQQAAAGIKPDSHLIEEVPARVVSGVNTEEKDKKKKTKIRTVIPEHQLTSNGKFVMRYEGLHPTQWRAAFKCFVRDETLFSQKERVERLLE